MLAGALRSLKVRPERMRAAIDSAMMATDLADYLVDKGLPFRQAHALAGKAVQYALEQGKALEALSLQEFRALSEGFGPVAIDDEVYGVFDPAYSIARRAATGGTAPQAVKEQIQQAKSGHAQGQLTSQQRSSVVFATYTAFPVLLVARP